MLRSQALACIGAAAACAIGFGSSVCGQVTSWTNATGNRMWADAGNWTAGVPTATVEARFSDGSFVPILLPATPAQQAARLSGTARFDNGRLETNSIAGALQVRSQVGALGSSLLLEQFPVIYGPIGDGATGGDFDVYGSAELLGANTYTGSTLVGGEIRLGWVGPLGLLGRLANTSRVVIPWNSQFEIGISPTGDNDRINDAAELRFHGGSFIESGNIVERLGPVTLANGYNTLLSNGSLTAQSIQTQGGTMYLGANNPLRLVDAPALTPDSGATDRAVLPYVAGFFSDPGSNLNGSFVTYDPGMNPTDPADDVGLRSLNLFTEYNSDLTAGGNVRLVSSATLTTDTAARSLMARNGTLTLSDVRLTLTDNALMLQGGQIRGTGTISFPGDAFVCIDPTFPANTQSYRLEAAVTAPTLTAVGAGGGTIAFAKPNDFPGGLRVVEGVVVSEVQGATGGATVTLVGNASLRTRGEQTIDHLVVDGLFADGPVVKRVTSEVGPSSDDPTSRLTIANSLRGSGELYIRGNLRFAGASDVHDLRMVMGGITPLDFRVDGVLGHESGGVLELHQSGHLTRFTGAGLFHGLVNSTGGTVAPGPGPARLSVDDLILGGGSTAVEIELNGLVAGESHDQLTVLESLSIDGTALDVGFAFVPEIGDRFRIFDNLFAGPVVGTFANLPQLATFFVDGYELQIDYLAGDGNDIVLTVVPEPAGAAFAVGLLAAGALRRRSHRRPYECRAGQRRTEGAPTAKRARRSRAIAFSRLSAFLPPLPFRWDRGEGSSGSQSCSRSVKNPHPSPFPEYREREREALTREAQRRAVSTRTSCAIVPFTSWNRVRN